MRYLPDKGGNWKQFEGISVEKKNKTVLHYKKSNIKLMNDGERYIACHTKTNNILALLDVFKNAEKSFTCFLEAALNSTLGYSGYCEANCINPQKPGSGMRYRCDRKKWDFVAKLFGSQCQTEMRELLKSSKKSVIIK